MKQPTLLPRSGGGDRQNTDETCITELPFQRTSTHKESVTDHSAWGLGTQTVTYAGLITFWPITNSIVRESRSHPRKSIQFNSGAPTYSSRLVITA